MRIRILFAWFLLAATVAHAQDYQRVAPKTPPPVAPGGKLQQASRANLSGDSRLVGKNLEGLIFVSKNSEVRKTGVSGMHGVKVENLPPLDTPEFLARVQPFLGRPITMNLINEVTMEVVKFYDDKNRPVVSATIPEQDITSGVVQIVVVEGILGKVRVTGNHWFDASLFRDDVQLRPGEPIYKSELQANLAAMNVNPFHSVNGVFRPGTSPGSTDVWLDVKDRFPLRVYTGYENTGTESTGEDQLIYGLNWGNAFGLDQQFNYQFTASTDFDRYLAHSASYIVPLPWGHRLNFFGVYDTSKVDLPAPFASSGQSYQGSGRYIIPLPTAGEYNEEFSFGYDYKNTNNNLEFGGAQVFNTTVAVSQFVLSYNSSLTDPWGATNFSADLYLSPGGMMAMNSTENFNAGTPGANAEYAYAQFGINRVTRLPADFSLYSKFTSQVASGTLFSTETLGAGGFDSVRGYAEREVNGDQGILMSQEIRTPVLHPLSLCHVPIDESLQFLVFSDTAYVTLKNPAPGIDSAYTLTSVGLGLRYAINPYLSVRADYGWQLLPTGFDSFHSRASIGATISY